MSVTEAPKEGRRARKRRELRARIQESAQQLFLELGYDHVTVEEVAERADVSRATFFIYYSSKSALLRELAEKATDELHERVAAKRDDAVAFEEQLVDLFRQVTVAVQKARRFSQDLFLENFRAEKGPDGKEELRPVRLSYLDVVESGRARGEVAEHHDPEFLAEMITAALAGVLSNWLNDPNYPLQERAEAAARFLARGMR
jgi:AcrR family transcriptional regulator